MVCGSGCRRRIIGAHVDVYKGEGNQAGVEANQLNHTGTLFVALPKRK